MFSRSWNLSGQQMPRTYWETYIAKYPVAATPGMTSSFHCCPDNNGASEKLQQQASLQKPRKNSSKRAKLKKHAPKIFVHSGNAYKYENNTIHGAGEFEGPGTKTPGRTPSRPTLRSYCTFGKHKKRRRRLFPWFFLENICFFGCFPRI